MSLRFDDLKGRLMIAGSSADELASLFAHACLAAGLKTLILDIDGRLAERISGYFESYDYTYFLYDTFQVDEEGPRHGQLIAAAYAAALDLSSEEEAIMNAGMHALAMKDSRATPGVLNDVLGSVEGFRGFYVDKLKGRIGGIRYLESAENGSFSSLLSLGSSLISFRDAKYPQAAEVAASIYVAKLLSALPASRSKPDLVIMNDAHRIFRANPRPQHANRLLGELLDASTTVALVSDQVHSLNRAAQDATPVRILSSDAWNEGVEGRWKGSTREPILPNVCVISDGHFGHQRMFVPRSLEPKVSELRSGPGVQEHLKGPDNELTRLILREIAQYDAPTRASLIEFLSGEYRAEDIKHELDRLHEQGHIAIGSAGDRSIGHPMLLYSLTDSGKELMGLLGA